MISLTLIRRSFRPTPGRLIAGLFALEPLLFLSDRFRWFGFGHHKGWAVLIALASLVAVIVLLESWTALAVVLRWRMQFSVRSLLALTVAASVALSWLATEMTSAKEQKAVVETITELGGWVWFDYEENNTAFLGTNKPPQLGPAAWAWLRKLLGDDFFANVTEVGLDNSKVTDASSDRIELKRLPRLVFLSFDDSEVTDRALGVHRGGNPTRMSQPA